MTITPEKLKQRLHKKDQRLYFGGVTPIIAERLCSKCNHIYYVAGSHEKGCPYCDPTAFITTPDGIKGVGDGDDFIVMHGPGGSKTPKVKLYVDEELLLEKPPNTPKDFETNCDVKDGNITFKGNVSIDSNGVHALTDTDIKALIERVRKGIAPEPLCRDCADNNGRCPVDNELCDSNERAVEVAEAVRSYIEQLEKERDVSRRHIKRLDSWLRDKNGIKKENEKLKKEIEVLRQYGNKDCTAMADEVLTTLESK